MVCPGIRGTVMCGLLFAGLCSCLHRYHFIDELKTWHEAQRHCRQRYSDLATVGSVEDVGRLVAAAGGGVGFEGKLWMGLYNTPAHWLWSLPPAASDGPAAHTFRRWSTGEPNDTRSRGFVCVSLQRGYWYDQPCSQSLPFVCYNDTDTADTISIERYFFINKKMKWGHARDHCREHYTDLVSVRNHSENGLVQQVVPGHQRVWIGLVRYSWVSWSDGAHVVFENWADGHPARLNENCAASVINATHLGKWMENQCEEKYHFMCQHDKTYVFNIKLAPLKSTVDLNDAAVTEGILNLMKEKLNEKGIKRDFRITWMKKPDKNVFHKEEDHENVMKTDL